MTLHQSGGIFAGGGTISGSRKFLFSPMFKPKIGAHKTPSRSKVRTGFWVLFCFFVSSECNKLTADYLPGAALGVASIARFRAAGISLSSNMLSIS